MTRQPDKPSPEAKPDATAKKKWVEPEIEIVPATETALGVTLGGSDFGSNIS
jgi:hypothetical protein